MSWLRLKERGLRFEGQDRKTNLNFLFHILEDTVTFHDVIILMHLIIRENQCDLQTYLVSSAHNASANGDQKPLIYTLTP